MKIIFPVFFIVIFSGCITIYKNDLSVKNTFPVTEDRSYQLVIEDHKLIQSGGSEPKISKISDDTQEKLRSIVQSRISNECANSRGVKELQVSFETTIDLDNTCWIFTLCYVVVPGMLTGTQRLKIKINKSENLSFADYISYRSYAHVLLLPALIYKPFDNRDTQAKVKLLEMFSDKFCSNLNTETFLKLEREL